MLIHNDSGFSWKTESKIYNLYEGFSTGNGGAFTSDILFIMDDENIDEPARVVSHIYGASMLDEEGPAREDICRTIDLVVREYEEVKK